MILLISASLAGIAGMNHDVQLLCISFYAHTRISPVHTPEVNPMDGSIFAFSGYCQSSSMGESVALLSSGSALSNRQHSASRDILILVNLMNVKYRISLFT
jgi:hypothetical protein